MPQDKMTFEQIAKVAEDVRTIQRFQDESVNEGFDSTFLAASVVPSANANKETRLDAPLLSLAFFVVVFIILLTIKYVANVSPKTEELLMVISLIAALLATISAQLKFKDGMTTGILGIGFLFILSIGFGIFTPKEAITEVTELVK